MKTLIKLQMMVVCTLVVLFGSGCRPYEKPKFELVEPHETAFVIPLTGKTSDQTKLASEQYYKDLQVATKEIAIPQRWIQTGYWWWQGEYRPTVKVITVDRAPVTREWTDDPDTGSAKEKQAIQSVTKEAVGILIPMNCTAEIQESDAAKFLYRYTNKSLTQVLDTEARAQINDTFGRGAAEVSVIGIAGAKGKIIDATRPGVVKYFKERGVTLTYAIQGRVTYDNDEIQKSIDKNIVAAQELKAQVDVNRRLQLAAQAMNNPQVRQYQMESWRHEEALKRLESNQLIAKGISGGKVQLPQSIGGQNLFTQAFGPK